MEIVTTVCVDEEPDDITKYNTLPRTDSESRREIFWRCTVVLMATAKRCQPESPRVVYTNDTDPVIAGSDEIRAMLKRLDVSIHHLPFRKFVPPAGVSRSYKNAFYRQEVLLHLGTKPEGTTLMLDSDCVWTRPDPWPSETAKTGSVILIDTYKTTDVKERIFGFSREDLGNMYRRLDPLYPNPSPIWFGGEIIGGRNDRLAFLGEEMLKVFSRALSHPDRSVLQLPNGQSFFDIDEYLTSFVHNLHLVPWVDAGSLLRRIWTIDREIRESEMAATIWHLPMEKKIGIDLLGREVANPQSEFWGVGMERFREYLGGFVGVPRRKVFSKQALELELRARAKRIMRSILHPSGIDFRKEVTF